MQFVLNALLIIIPAIIAITLHEAAHGYAALALGDQTAKRAGRLSLNPMRHIDRAGTVILPAILMIGQLISIGHVGFMFGWAKPVPVSPMEFSNPRRMMALVAAAGPASNFFLAWIGALLFHLVIWVPLSWHEAAFMALQYFILTNLVLGLFNLLPIPPLDGGRIAVGILPARVAVDWAKIEKFGIVLVLGFGFIVPHIAKLLGYSFDPLAEAMHHLLPSAMRIVFKLAGLPTDG